MLRQETFLDREDAAILDWDKLAHQVKELQRAKISAGVLANQRQTADVFAQFVESLLDGRGCRSSESALHVLAVIGDAFVFPNNADRRALRVHKQICGFYFKLMPIGAGNWDHIESVLKPLHPTHFEFSSSVRFRRALASFIDKLEDLSHSAASGSPTCR